MSGEQDDFLENAKVGYVFYYPELNDCKIIECEPDKSATMREELEQFEQWVCKILYVINERKPLRASSRSKTALAEQDKRCSHYCIGTELSVLEQQKVIGDIFFGESSQNSV